MILADLTVRVSQFPGVAIFRVSSRKSVSELISVSEKLPVVKIAYGLNSGTVSESKVLLILMAGWLNEKVWIVKYLQMRVALLHFLTQTFLKIIS
jgi:hypothetical protein